MATLLLQSTEQMVEAILAAVQGFLDAVEKARASGGTIQSGGTAMTDRKGNFVLPTLVTDRPGGLARLTELIAELGGAIDIWRYAAALARELHDVDKLSAFFDIIQQDPILSELKLIADAQKAVDTARSQVAALIGAGVAVDGNDVLAVYEVAGEAPVFEIYFTYLELFVIHAICAWCVGSAVVVTLVEEVDRGGRRDRPFPLRLGIFPVEP